MNGCCWTATLELVDDSYVLGTVCEDSFTAGMDMAVEVTKVEGQYQDKTATPTESTQVILPDQGYNALTSVTVNPIPPNYGLITWNGRVITVS